MLGASGAGVLYRLINPETTAQPTTWFKPAGGTAYRLDPRTTALAGARLYSRLTGEGAISYRILPSGAARRCVVPDTATVVYSDSGWLQQLGAGADIVLVTAVQSGCSSRRLTTIGKGRLLAADKTGFAVDVTVQPGNGAGIHDLLYVPFADPAHPVRADRDVWIHDFVSMSAGAIAWARTHQVGESRGAEVHRWSRTTGADPVAMVDASIRSTAVAPGATGFAGCASKYAPLRTCVVGSIPAGGGTVSLIAGATQVSDDDVSLYLARFGGPTGIDRGSSFADPGALTRVVSIPLLPPATIAIALGAGRAAYIDSDGVADPAAGDQRALHWRFAAKSGNGIGLLAPFRGPEPVDTISIDGRRQLIGRTGSPGQGSLILRTEGGEPDVTVFRDVPGQSVYLGGKLQVSGTRALWIRHDLFENSCPPSNCPVYTNRSAMLYDVRTRTSTRLGDATTTRWALWGPYVVWANRDGSIYRRDLASNRTVAVKPKGNGVVGLDVWGPYVGWSECVSGCWKGNVAYRNVDSGAAAVRIAVPGSVPTAVRVTGGHVVYAHPDGLGDRATHLRELRLGTTATASIAEVVGWADAGAWWFDAHDEVLAWISRGDQRAMVAPNSAYVDPPKYLGNALGSASFTPNGDGVADAWTPEFPVSKALPVCQVVIRSKITGSVLRRLPCAASTGSARASWDGRLTTGRLVPPGSYSWTLTGSDSDGALRWWTGSTTPIAGSVQVGRC